MLQASDVSVGMEPGWRKAQERQLTITSLPPAYVADSWEWVILDLKAQIKVRSEAGHDGFSLGQPDKPDQVTARDLEAEQT